MSLDNPLSGHSEVELVNHVNRCIVARTGRQLTDLEVTLVGGAMQVKGIADSFYTKQLVTHAVLREVSTLELINAVDVRPATRPTEAAAASRPGRVRSL